MDLAAVVASIVWVVVNAGPTSEPARPTPPAGLGARGLPAVDLKAVAFENELLQEINAHRKKAGKDPLTMDERARAFARREAALAATEDASIENVEQRIREQGIAPAGHRLQFTYGTRAAEVLKDLQKTEFADALLLGEFARAAVGAFWVPVKPPYFQVTLLMLQDVDPMAGKPGLTEAQTAPVMEQAGPHFKECYNTALKLDPNLRGDAVITLAIGAKGGVDEAKFTKKTFISATLDGCLLAVARGLVFPAPYKGKTVTYNHPIRFIPPQGERRIGFLSDQQVTNAFLPISADLRACFDERIKDKPALSGTITLAINVGGEGQINKLDVAKDEPGDAALRACVLDQAKKVRFPKPEHRGEVDLTFPIRFDK